MKISTIVFLIKNNKIFLAKKKRGFGMGFYNGYGGKKNQNDTSIENTAKRELKEEAEIIAIKLEKMALIEFFEKETLIFKCYVYFCYEWQGDPRETDEMSIPEQFDIDNIPYDRMWHSDRTWLPIIFSGKKIHAKSYYNIGMTHQDRFEEFPLEEDF